MIAYTVEFQLLLAVGREYYNLTWFAHYSNGRNFLPSINSFHEQGMKKAGRVTPYTSITSTMDIGSCILQKNTLVFY
jgi:hypothetical protein